MAGYCFRCNQESLMFANFGGMFPVFCWNCDPHPTGIVIVEEEEE